ncbi:MAG: DNA methyltransferase, partial [Nitrososphaerota archaeon]
MRSKFVAILSGDNVPLARAELKSLLEIFTQKSIIDQISSRIVLFEADSNSAAEVIKRAGYIKSIIQPILIEKSSEICESSLILDSICNVVQSPLMIRVEKLGVSNIDSRTLEKMTFDVLNRVLGNLKISFENPSTIVKVYVEGGLIVGGVLVGEKDTKSLEARRPGKRPFKHPSAIHPKLARCLVNLTRARVGGLILDPFMGTGSIPLEASLMGYTAIGVELKTWVCHGSVRNIKFLGNFSKVHTIIGDSRKLMFNRRIIDGVATDPPYGRSTTIPGGDLSTMLETIFTQLLEIVKKDARIVTALPHGTDFINRLSDMGLKIEEQFTERVHASLIRDILVCSL